MVGKLISAHSVGDVCADACLARPEITGRAGAHGGIAYERVASRRSDSVPK